MDFALTDDQTLIRDAAESFLADVSDSAGVRRAATLPLGYDESVWQRIGAELGWCGVAIPEEHGGLGLGPVTLALIQEQAGRRLLCAPFYGTVCVAGSGLMEVGSEAAREAYLPRLAAGELRIAVPLSGTDEWLRVARGVRARAQGDGWVLDGPVPRQLDAAGADLLFVFAAIEGGGLGLFAVEAKAAGVAIQPRETWDATRRFADVTLRGVRAQMRVDDPERIEHGMARAAALARLYLAAEQLGGAQQCLDLTVAYTLGRKQFGRPVAGFQAVKHRCAEMMVRIEALRSAVYGAAALAAGEASPERVALEGAMAKQLASDTFFWCAQEAIQLHGGVGFTWEYDPQLYFKRAQASSHWLGSAEELREELAAALIDGGVAA